MFLSHQNMPVCIIIIIFLSFYHSFLHQSAFYSSHLFLRIYQHIMLHLHISTVWSSLKCYSKSLIRNQLAKRVKRNGELKLTLCGLSLILKVMNELRTQSNKNKRFSWLWHSYKETQEPRGREGGRAQPKPPLPALPLWRSGDTEKLTAWAVLKEEGKIQSDKQGSLTPNVAWAPAIICLTSSQTSAYDPMLFSLPAEFIQMLMALAAWQWRKSLSVVTGSANIWGWGPSLCPGF